MIGLHGAYAGEVFAFARERQAQLAAEVERERLVRQARLAVPRRLFAWPSLLRPGRSAEVVSARPASQPVCC